jgi:hypothetical protein
MKPNKSICNKLNSVLKKCQALANFQLKLSKGHVCELKTEGWAMNGDGNSG